MTDLVRFEIPDGGDVLIEAEDVDEGLIPVKRGQDGIFDTGMFFSDRLDSIQDAVKEALKKLRMTNPDEIKVSFGIKFTAAAGAVIARTSVEGALGVEMSWRRTD